MIYRRKVQSGENPSIQRNQMRGELENNGLLGGARKFLFNFREVPVFGNSIRPRALIAFDE